MKDVLIENTIMQKGEQVDANSKMLENFVSPFNAVIIDRLLSADYNISGRLGTQEFGIDNIYSTKTSLLPNIDLALCNDIFGTYRRLAPQNDLIYIHPTYGSVPRHGLIPLVSSMDQIGILCKSHHDGFELLSVISGKSDKDSAMLDAGPYKHSELDTMPKIYAPLPLTDAFTTKCDIVQANLDMELLLMANVIMHIIAAGEISNNISRYDGVRFGYRTKDYTTLDDLYINSRTEGFTLDTKLMSVLGAYVQSADQYEVYYNHALKLRGKLQKAINFDTYDIIALPTTIGNDCYKDLSLYALAPLLGLPSISFSCGDIGLMLLAKPQGEKTLQKALEVFI